MLGTKVIAAKLTNQIVIRRPHSDLCWNDNFRTRAYASPVRDNSPLEVFFELLGSVLLETRKPRLRPFVECKGVDRF